MLSVVQRMAPPVIGRDSAAPGGRMSQDYQDDILAAARRPQNRTGNGLGRCQHWNMITSPLLNPSACTIVGLVETEAVAFADAA
jgi:hypothetical protein